MSFNKCMAPGITYGSYNNTIQYNPFETVFPFPLFYDMRRGSGIEVPNEIS